MIAPLLPVKNRPFSTGPEKQGVTPTIRVGAPRSRPSSLSLFTQPLNPGLLMATCGNTESGLGSGPWGAEEGRQHLAGEGREAGQDGTHWEPGAVATGRKAPHKKRVWSGALLPLVLPAWPLLALGPDPVCHQLNPTSLPAHGHLGVGRGTSGWELPDAPRPTALCSLSQSLTVCHWPVRERWRLWTRSWGPGPSV